MNRLREFLHLIRLNKSKLSRFGLGTVVFLAAIACFLAPFVSPAISDELVGFLLAISGCAEVMHSFRLVGKQNRWEGYVAGAVTVGMGLLVLAAPLLLSSALIFFLALGFAADGFQHLTSIRGRIDDQTGVFRAAALATGNFLIAGLLLLNPHFLPTLAIAGGLRLLAEASAMLSSPVLDVSDAGEQITAELDLPDYQELHDLADQIANQEEAARTVDRRWILLI